MNPGLQIGQKQSYIQFKANLYTYLTLTLLGLQVGQDEDLSGGPLLYLWAPNPKRDKPWRRYQHLYVAGLFSLLHVLWRIDSLRVVWSRKIMSEALPLIAHYAVYLSIMPPQTFIAQVRPACVACYVTLDDLSCCRGGRSRRVVGFWVPGTQAVALWYTKAVFRF